MAKGLDMSDGLTAKGLDVANKHIGSNFDDFLAEEALLEEATATAMKRVIAWQIEQERKAQRLTDCSTKPIQV
jgi:hypothetical protein